MSGAAPTQRPTVARAALTGWLTALACIVVAAIGLQVSEPEADVQSVVGVPSEQIPYGSGSVLVDNVRVGQRIEQFGQVHKTPGVFVVLSTTLAADGNSTQWLNSFALLSGDRVYQPYRSETLKAAPGFQQTDDVVFEVDPQEIDGLVLRTYYSEILSSYHQVVLVPLGITAENAHSWRDAAVNQTIEIAGTADRAIP